MTDSERRMAAAGRALFGAAASTPGRRPGQDAAGLGKRDQERIKAREAVEREQAAKTAKLRALRLAREAEDAERARAEADAAAARKRASKRRRAAAPATDPAGD